MASTTSMGEHDVNDDAPVARADEPTPRPPADGASLVRQMLPKLVLSLGLGALFAFLVSRGGMPLLPTMTALAHVRWDLFAVYLLVMCGMHFFRASRWRFLIAPTKQVPFREGVLLNWIGFFAIFALPLRLGELARPALTKIRQGISISVGFGTVAVERVFDGLLTSMCVVWALAVLPQRATEDPIAAHLPYYGWLAVSVFGAAFAGLVLFLWQRTLATKLIELTFGLVSKSLAAKVAEKVGGIAEGIRSIASPRLAFGFLTESLLYWGMNALGMWILGNACGLELTFGHAVAVMGILAIGILLPAGPGLFGNFQLAISVALKLYFAESIVASEGAVYVFLLYITQAILICTSGIVPLYALKLRFSDLLRTDGATATA